jgi:hypothetical protein
MGIEPETREFLMRIVHTISLVLLWMMANLTLGVYNNLAFFEGTPDWKNIAYYIFFLISLSALLLHLSRRWKLK